jgi:hypothetical protein
MSGGCCSLSSEIPIGLNRFSIMAALVAAIHVFACRNKVVDTRDKPGEVRV